MTESARCSDMDRIRRYWPTDLLASLVVFLVALPLCMGIAIASGVPPAAGLISGIVGGIVVGLTSGAPLQVSGPAAGLAVIAFELVQEHGMQAFALIVATAGMLQMAAGAVRLGQWFRAVSPAVIQGMLAGIGVLIFASQFHVMVDDRPQPSGIANLLSIPAAIWKGMLPGEVPSHYWAARIGLLTILITASWKLLAPKRLKIVPAPLVAVVTASAVAAASNLDIDYISVGDVFANVRFPTSELVRSYNRHLLLEAIGVAFVASAETLLCANALDKLHNDPALRTRYDKELFAQGLGNLICGVLGGLPVTGVIVRSATNVEAGARTRLSAIAHGVWMLTLVTTSPQLLNYIPTSSLAAILVFTGYKLMNPKALRELLQYGKIEVAVYFATVATIVVEDLLTGVIVGICLSAARLLHQFSRVQTVVVSDPKNNRTRVQLRGAATFIGLPKIAAALDGIGPATEIHVDLEHLDFIDHACLDLLMNWGKRHELAGGRLIIDWGALTDRFHQGNSALDVEQPRSEAVS